MSIRLVRIKRSDPRITSLMAAHYSQPKGFVGRNICYAVYFENVCYGAIAGGSATRFLPGRKIVYSLNNGVNNIFFHIEPGRDGYPLRNFSSAVLREYRRKMEIDWFQKYGDVIFWHETLVELPRKGECYVRDGWEEVGTTKGFTCKRTSGVGTDTWSGKRVWDTVNLRPKLVFVRKV